MIPDKLKEVHSARPFRPFQIRLAHGETYTVDHPEFLAISRAGRTAYFVDPDDRGHHIDVFLIIELIELPDLPGDSTANGTHNA